MDSDLSPDTADDDASPAAKQRRLSTTVTLLGAVACVVLAKTLAIGAPAMPSAAAAPHQGVTPVTIVAPEFCKNQTWPYIDARCLRRVDPAPPPAEARNASAAPVNSGAVNSGPVTAPPAPAPVIHDGVPPSPEASPAAAPSQVIQSVFPTTGPGTVAQNDLQSAGADTSAATPTYQRVTDPMPPRHSRHWRHGIFSFGGFRF
jgi:hypothetical protein